MALNCPSCDVRLSALTLRASFACPSCGAQLRGHTKSAFALSFGLWLLADLLLMLLLPAFVESQALALTLRILLSAAVGLSLVAWALPAWSRVERGP